MSSGVIPFITSPFGLSRQNSRTRGLHQAPNNTYVTRHVNVQNIAVVENILQETDAAVTVVFSTHKEMTFKAGQYVACKFTIDGNIVERCYSLSDMRDDGLYQITVKETENGYVSRFINRQLSIGDSFQIARVDGNITPEIIDNSTNHLVLFAGGSGITPLFTLAKWALQHSRIAVTLVYSNRTQKDTIFLNQLTTLENTYNNFKFLNLLDTTKSKTDIKGPLSAAILKKYDLINENNLYAACGPGGYVELLYNLLKDANIDKKKIHLELFSRANTTDADNSQNQTDFSIRLENNGKSFKCSSHETLLDAAKRSGINLDHSCQMGGCGHCKVKLISGNVTLPEPNCLTDQEQANGYTLTCIGQPQSNLIIAMENS